MQMLVGILTECLIGMKLSVSQNSSVSQNTLSIINICVSVSYLNPITSSNPTYLSVYNVMPDSDQSRTEEDIGKL